MTSKKQFSYSKDELTLIEDCLKELTSASDVRVKCLAKLKKAAIRYSSNIKTSDNQLPDMKQLREERFKEQDDLKAASKGIPRNTKLHQETHCVDPHMKMHNLCEQFLEHGVPHIDIENEIFHSVIERRIAQLNDPDMLERYIKEPSKNSIKNRSSFIASVMQIYAKAKNISFHECPSSKTGPLIELLHLCVNPVLLFAGRKDVKEGTFSDEITELKKAR